MVRFLSLPVLAAAAALAPAQVVIQGNVVIQQGNGGVLVFQNDGSAVPAAKPAKAKGEFKPDPNANPDPKSLAVPAETLEKAQKLVKQLGSPSYREREAASRELTKMGRTAYGPLKVALQGEDSAEIRLRIDELLPEIENKEMEVRVSCFLADKDGKFDHDLPGWAKFREVAGNETATRELFALVLSNKVSHTLLLAADLPAVELGGVIAGHFRELQNAQNNFNGNVRFVGRGGNIQANAPNTAEIAVLLFLEGMYTDKQLHIDYNWSWTVANYLHQQDIQSAMTNRTNKYGAPLKKLTMRWLETRETSNGAQMAFNYADQWGLPNKLKFAARTVAAPTENGNWWIKQQALVRLGQGKTKEYIPQIAQCFEDTTVVQQGQPVPGNNAGNPHTIHLQDFALAVALQISGQKPKDYGFDSLTATQSDNWNQNNWYFKDDKTTKADDKRKAAFKKWDEWYTANKKDLPAPKDELPKKDESKKPETPSDTVDESKKKDDVIEKANPAEPVAPALAPPGRNPFIK